MNKTKKGFTLLELLIALAILAIIAAILIPNFFATTDRARLRSDIQSARVIQNAIELYNAERRTPLAGSMTEMLVTLETEGFLRVRYTRPQTEGAEWEIYDDVVLVNIHGSPPNIHSIYSSLPASEQAFVRHGRAGN